MVWFVTNEEILPEGQDIDRFVNLLIYYDLVDLRCCRNGVDHHLSLFGHV